MSEEDTMSCNDPSLMEDRKKGSLKHKKHHEQLKRSVSSTDVIEMTEEEKKQIATLSAMKYPKITKLDLLKFLFSLLFSPPFLLFLLSFSLITFHLFFY